MSLKQISSCADSVVEAARVSEESCSVLEVLVQHLTSSRGPETADDAAYHAVSDWCLGRQQEWETASQRRAAGIRAQYQSWGQDLKSRDCLLYVQSVLTAARDSVTKVKTDMSAETLKCADQVLRRCAAEAVERCVWLRGIAYLYGEKQHRAYGICELEELSDEVVARVADRFRRGASVYRPEREQKPGAWFSTTVHLDVRRRDTVLPGCQEISEDLTDPRDPGDELEQDETLERVAALLAQLSRLEECIVVFTVFDNATAAELGKQFGMSSDDVTKTYNRLIKWIHDQIDPD